MRDTKADKVGFEPTIRLPVYSISNAAPSTARTPVQWREHYSEEVWFEDDVLTSAWYGVAGDYGVFSLFCALFGARLLAGL